jgi:hypothetical protein
VAGDFYTVGVKDDGTVVTVGDNSYGQRDVSSWSGIRQVAASEHTAGLKSDGTVVAVGRNSEGQCDVSGWSGITQVAAGGWLTIGLKTDGTVVKAGFSSGDVSGWSGIVQVAAGAHHTVGVKEDGTVVAVGFNDDGQCDVTGWSGIVQLAAGGFHTIGLKADGSVVATGRNTEGQCDITSWTLDYCSPTAIKLSAFTAIPSNGKVTLVWETETELDNAGFNIYRSESENGSYAKLNSALIPAKGSAAHGATYEFADRDVQNRKTYYYKLEDIDLYGKSTMHGPVSAMPRLIYGIGK